jgi:hypothetical protein
MAGELLLQPSPSCASASAKTLSVGRYLNVGAESTSRIQSAAVGRQPIRFLISDLLAGNSSACLAIRGISRNEARIHLLS